MKKPNRLYLQDDCYVEFAPDSSKLLFMRMQRPIGAIFTDPLVTDNGQTVGERNRADLHALLDKFFDGTLETEA